MKWLASLSNTSSASAKRSEILRSLRHLVGKELDHQLPNVNVADIDIQKHLWIGVLAPKDAFLVFVLGVNKLLQDFILDDLWRDHDADALVEPCDLLESTDCLFEDVVRVDDFLGR